VLLALGSTVKVLGPKGEREIPLAKFFHAPTGPDQREHVLAANEIVLSVLVVGKVPEQFYRLHNASYEVRHKQSYDWPLVQAAVAVPVKDGTVKDARVVLGHVGPTPVFSEAAAKALEGKALNEETATAAGEAAAGDDRIKPLGQNAYKVRLIAVAVKRALLTAARGKKYWEV
jgi:xanthine dehydrogenase YagS FAD-binding subunit